MVKCKKCGEPIAPSEWTGIGTYKCYCGYNGSTAEKHTKERITVKIKKLDPAARIPEYATPGDAGMDLTAISMSIDDYGNHVYGTGLAFEIPEGYVGLLFMRSSNAKTDLILTNAVGVIDSGYRGEVMFKYRQMDSVRTEQTLPYVMGDRVGQIIIMPYPQVKFEVVEKLTDSERGTGGYGHTGK